MRSVSANDTISLFCIKIRRKWKLISFFLISYLLSAQLLSLTVPVLSPTGHVQVYSLGLSRHPGLPRLGQAKCSGRKSFCIWFATYFSCKGTKSERSIQRWIHRPGEADGHILSFNNLWADSWELEESHYWATYGPHGLATSWNWVQRHHSWNYLAWIS